MIETGTICYIIKTEPGNEHLLGRVVEVIGPALPAPERGGVLMHQIDADWLRAEYPRHRPYCAQPSHLRPIAGPGSPPPAKLKPELVS